ncbi:MAG: tyrosine-type recombinase/integrase, partial [Desulfovibrio sp.]|nr:tyrosine-type recombinase/integrase [Desulfovibrio sp.]
LRHTCATAALRAGVPLPDVQAVLRHRSAGTTMQYAHAIARERNRTEAVVAAVVDGRLDASGRPAEGGSGGGSPGQTQA